MTLTVTFILKIANLDFVATGAFMFHKHFLFLFPSLKTFFTSVDCCYVNMKIVIGKLCCPMTNLYAAFDFILEITPLYI